MTLHISERERATLAVALRAWQNELSYHTKEELQDYYPDLRGVEPLSIDEVERLLTQLQTTHGSDAVTVGSVRPSAGGAS